MAKTAESYPNYPPVIRATEGILTKRANSSRRADADAVVAAEMSALSTLAKLVMTVKAPSAVLHGDETVQLRKISECISPKSIAP